MSSYDPQFRHSKSFFSALAWDYKQTIKIKVGNYWLKFDYSPNNWAIYHEAWEEYGAFIEKLQEEINSHKEDISTNSYDIEHKDENLVEGNNMCKYIIKTEFTQGGQRRLMERDVIKTRSWTQRGVINIKGKFINEQEPWLDFEIENVEFIEK